MTGHTWISSDAAQPSFIALDTLSDSSEAPEAPAKDRPLPHGIRSVDADNGFSVAVIAVVEYGQNESSFVVDDRIRPDGEDRLHRAAWKVRIQELRAFAEEDGDPFNTASERDFWAFVEANPSVRKGALVLVDSGDLRAVWEGDGDPFIGVEFLGGGVLRYVIFNRLREGGEVSRVVGRDDFDGFRRQVEAFDLLSLLYE